ncbi:MAG: hypothetical protein ACK449_02350 [Planctomycetota bacterium]
MRIGILKGANNPSSTKKRGATKSVAALSRPKYVSDWARDCSMAIRVTRTEAMVKRPRIHINRAWKSPRYNVVIRKYTSDPIIRMIRTGAKAASA